MNGSGIWFICPIIRKKCRIEFLPIYFVGQFVEWVRLETTAANESDIKHLETPLLEADLPKGIPVFADKGYDSAENREVLKCIKLKCRIIHKATRGHKLTERQQRINVAISKVRYCMERTFGSIHRWFLSGVAGYVGWAETHAQHMMEAIAYNLYRTPEIIAFSFIKQREK